MHLAGQARCCLTTSPATQSSTLLLLFMQDKLALQHSSSSHRMVCSHGSPCCGGSCRQCPCEGHCLQTSADAISVRKAVKQHLMRRHFHILLQGLTQLQGLNVQPKAGLADSLLTGLWMKTCIDCLTSTLRFTRLLCCNNGISLKTSLQAAKTNCCPCLLQYPN